MSESAVFLIVPGFLILIVFIVFYLRPADATAELRSIRAMLHEAQNKIRENQQQVPRQIQALIKEVRDKKLATTSIRELKDYGANGARWSALENVRINTIAKLPKASLLEQIEGIGPVSAQKIRNAQARFYHKCPISILDIESATQYSATKAALASTARYNHQEKLLHDLQIQVNPRLQKHSSVELVFSSRAVIDDATRELKLIAAEVAIAIKEINYTPKPVGSDDLPRTNEVADALMAAGLNVVKTLESRSDGRAAPGTEKHFEDHRVEPWLQDFGVNFERQHKIVLKVGSNRINAYVDFVLHDDRGQIVSLIESKRRISSERDLEEAILQAKSYALHLQIHRFLVASPDGIWIVEWSIQGHSVLRKFSKSEVHSNTREILKMIGVPFRR